MAVSRMPRPAAAAAVTMTPKEIWGIIRRHIWLIIFLGILGFVFGGAAWYLVLRYAPKYTAQTYIKVLPPGEKNPTMIGGALANKDLQYAHRASIAALIKQQNTLQKLLEKRLVKETEWFTSFGETASVRITKAVKDLKKRFMASAQRDGEFVMLGMTCGDKKEAALIVNTMLELFISSHGIKQRAAINARLKSLRAQEDSIKTELSVAERSLEAVRTSFNITDLREHSFRNPIEEKLNKLEISQEELTVEMRRIETAIETLRKRAMGPVNVQTEHEIERDPIMLNLAQQAATQESALAGLLTRFGENHRVVTEMRETINETKAKRQTRKVEIAEMTRQSNLRSAQDAWVSFQSSLEELNTRREKAVAEKKQLDLAKIQYAKREEIRDEIRKRLDDTKGLIQANVMLHDAPETPKVVSMGAAPEPLEVSSPKWQVYFPAGTMLGFMLGAGLAFLIELLNDLVRTPRDVGRHLRIPLLGVIPDADEDPQIDGIDLCHIVRQAPYSITSESYRQFRTNLKLFESAESSKALLVTSGAAGDGRTSVAVNVATSFVAENKKVLLIDANFWRPKLYKVFPNNHQQSDEQQEQEQSEFGLSTLLTGLCGYHEVVRSSGIENFDIIDSGLLPSNPAELLGNGGMKQLIKHQRENYDYVIIDGPPLLLVSDVKSLTKIVDGTILVFNAETTRRGVALRCIRELREVNATVVGCVLFAVKSMKGGYFGKHFKSYQKFQESQLAQTI